jgi:hypothetical protein
MFQFVQLGLYCGREKMLRMAKLLEKKDCSPRAVQTRGLLVILCYFFLALHLLLLAFSADDLAVPFAVDALALFFSAMLLRYPPFFK